MRLPASLRAALYVVGIMVGTTGIAWLLAHEGWRRIALICMEVHGSAAMVLLVLVGAAAALHAPTGWRERKNRLSGVVLGGVLIILVATGALLYYAGDERLRGAASVVHWVIGLASVAAASAHILLGRRPVP